MATISFTPVVFANAKRADGSYNVKIRVYFKGKDRKLATTLNAYPQDLTKKLAIRSVALKEQCDDLVKRMRGTLSDLTFAQLDAWDVDDIVAHVKKNLEEFHLDFFTYADFVMAKKEGQSRKNYKTAVNKFREYIGRDSLDINDITSSTLRGFREWIEQRTGKDSRAVSLYLSALSSIHRDARERYNNELEQPVRNPFEYFKVPKQSASQHRSSDVSLVRDMMKDRATLEGDERLGVDLFLISFVTMGMNVPDIYSCTRSEKVIRYERTKTRDRRADHAEMQVRVEPELEPFLKEYRVGRRDRCFNFHNRFQRYENLGRAANLGLHSYTASHRLPSVTMYSARHTWATIAYSIGIEKAIINDCLCHVDRTMRVTDIYIRKDWSRLWDANRKVLDYVFKEITPEV